MKKNIRLLTGILALTCVLTSCNMSNSGKNSNLELGEMIIGNDKIKPEQQLPIISEKVDTTTLDGKIVAGYQGWFQAPHDGSGMQTWGHWVQLNGLPNPLSIKIETFPETSEYENLYQTAYKPMSDGSPTKLFSAYDEQTVDTHFKWMNQYGVDVAAVQRFQYAFVDYAPHFDKVLQNIMASSEKYGRGFFIEYDITGASDPNLVEQLKKDYLRLVNEMKVTSSPNYMFANGKPVVELWGIGLNDSDKQSTKAVMDMINWFKAQGCYVIGGVDAGWRANDYGYANTEDYTQIYAAFDMLNPWTVGRHKNITGATKYTNDILKKDMELLRSRNQKMMPVIYSGISWSNWYPGNPKPNGTPRKFGEYIWEQFKGCINQKVDTIFIAMFDEYDEATGIAKTVTDSLGLPAQDNAYFLTLSADGKFLSSDFYLRLAGEMNQIIKGKKPFSDTITIAPTNGPLWLRTGFEKGYDVVMKNNSQVDSITNFEGTVESVKGEKSKARETSVKLSGKSSDNSNAIFSIIDDQSITVTKDTRISYWQYAENIGGQKVSIELTTTDGTTLSSTNASKLDPLSNKKLHSELQNWSKISFPIGEYLEGKTIKTVSLKYTSKTGEDVICYIDDLTIYEGE